MEIPHHFISFIFLVLTNQAFRRQIRLGIPPTIFIVEPPQVSGTARTPALVVVPLSCAGNWAREAANGMGDDGEVG